MMLTIISKLSVPDTVMEKYFVSVTSLSDKKFGLFKSICTLAMLPPKPVVAIALDTNISYIYFFERKKGFFPVGGDGGLG